MCPIRDALSPKWYENFDARAQNAGRCFVLRPRSGFAFFAALFAIAMGCEPQAPMAALIELEPFAPHTLRTGDALRLRGTGFEVGAHGELTLEGMFHRPGLPPVARQVRLEVAASASDRLSATLDDTHVSALGGRGTFRGRIEVRFELGTHGLTGSLDDVVIDVDPQRRAGTRRLSALGREAAAELGLELEGLHFDRGAPVSAVSEVGEALGFRVGDRIQSAGGVLVRSPADLRSLALPGAEVQVERDRGCVVIALPGGEAQLPEAPWQTGAACLLFLLLLGPPSRALGAWSIRLRRDWKGASPHGLQLLAAIAASLLALLWDGLPAAVVATALFWCVLSGDQPLERLMRAAAWVVVAALVRRLAFTPGGLEPPSWPLLREPALLALALTSALALSYATASDEGGRQRSMALARGAGVVWLVQSYVSEHAFVMVPMAMAASAALSSASPPISLLAVAAAATFGLHAFPVASAPELVLLPLALALAAAVAWVRTRPARSTALGL